MDNGFNKDRWIDSSHLIVTTSPLNIETHFYIKKYKMTKYIVWAALKLILH